MNISNSENSVIHNSAILGENVSVWFGVQVREHATIGSNTILGSYVYVDANVRIGKNCKIQNGASLFDPAVIHNEAFIGPGAILTNDKNPRATTTSGEVKKAGNWEKSGVEVQQGASIGAGAICVAPVTIGRWALVGAGSVVIRDVKDFALVVGNPARQVGWVGRAGIRLTKISDGVYQCPQTLTKYEEKKSQLTEIIEK
jgi:acetyltransferase-like isoleucine patch superfamily enzyme